jgi:hypothetical protein
MGGHKFRGLDPSPGWINRKFRDIDTALRELRAEKRLPGSQVAEGTDFSVRGILRVIGALRLVGDMSLQSEEGVEIVRLGDMPFGRGMTFVREDGTEAFTFRKSFANSTHQDWSFKDRAGSGVVEENLVGAGLGKPSLEHPFQPVAASSGTAVTCGPWGWERSSTAGTFETLFAYDGKVQNPFLDFKFVAVCSDGTTSGEIQVVDLVTGIPLPGFLSSASWLGVIPLGTTTQTIIDPTPDQVTTPIGAGFGAQMRLGVQVRRTAGAGTITLAVPQAIGG